MTGMYRGSIGTEFAEILIIWICRREMAAKCLGGNELNTLEPKTHHTAHPGTVFELFIVFLSILANQGDPTLMQYTYNI